jgi:cytochrome c oxidase cbb3-type subunit III
MKLLIASSLALAVSVMGACEREKREFHQSGVVPDSAPVTELYPGGGQSYNPEHSRPQDFKYEKNAYALSQGKMLYSSYNCSGCHANGGGGIGPALMDDQWIYGYEPDQVYKTILEGRPNGMPTFRGKIPDEQLKEIVAYVRSLSGQAPKAAAPGRDDHMSGKPAESSTEKRSPNDSMLPPSAVH